MSSSNADIVTDYAEKVVKGDVLCGELHKQACRRHLNDLERENTADFPYWWDKEAANRIIRFSSKLSILEGVEQKQLDLIPSQKFDIGCTFGWKKMSNDCRRFRRRYKSVGRQNGKTVENALMGTYIAGFSGYRYGKLFTVANMKRQSRIAWEEMAKFIKADKDLLEMFTVKDYKSQIISNNTECTIEALSKEAGLQDGFRAIFSSIDELHEMKENKIYKAMVNGTRSLPETLVSMITTRGYDVNSFCYEMDNYAQEILNGNSTAEDFFVDIYALDKHDDIWKEDNWIKSNPYICLDEERMNTLRQDAQTARDMGGADLRDFMTKCLNMWVRNNETQFINPDDWQACGTAKTLEVIAKSYKDCWVGLDLSSGGDLTTLCLEFPIDDRFYIYSHSFMPRGRLMEHIETDVAPYDVWNNQGLITVTGGESDYMNDYGFIINHLRELKERLGLNFLGVGIDPHNAAGLLSDLENLCGDVVLVTQSARNLNDATVAVQLLTKGKQFMFDRKNELLSWSMCNAAVTRNSFDEIKVDKKPGMRNKRIDPCDALIDAHAVMLMRKKEEVIDYDDALSSYLSYMGWK